MEVCPVSRWLPAFFFFLVPLASVNSPAACFPADEERLPLALLLRAWPLPRLSRSRPRAAGCGGGRLWVADAVVAATAVGAEVDVEVEDALEAAVAAVWDESTGLDVADEEVPPAAGNKSPFSSRAGREGSGAVQIASACPCSLQRVQTVEGHQSLRCVDALQ